MVFFIEKPDFPDAFIFADSAVNISDSRKRGKGGGRGEAVWLEVGQEDVLVRVYSAHFVFDSWLWSFRIG